MTEQERDEQLRNMAKAYADGDGEALRKENEALEQRGVRYLTPKADKAAKRLARAGERRSMPRGAWSAIAAAIVLLVLVPSVLALNGRFGKSYDDTAMAGAAQSAMESTETAVTEEAEQAADAAAGEASEEAAMGAAEDAAEAPIEAEAAPETGAPGLPADAGASTQLMPLPFSLPENFTVEKSEVDDGQSIYYLNNTLQDDVVLTMEYADDTEKLFEGLTPYDLDGTPVYLRSSGGYNFLTFQQDGILYTLSCKHDVNTLLELARGMLAQGTS